MCRNRAGLAGCCGAVLAGPPSGQQRTRVLVSPTPAAVRTAILHLPAACSFATNPARVKHRKVLLPALQAIFAAQPRDHWVRLLTPTAVTVAPVNSVAEALADPQVAARDMVVDVLCRTPPWGAASR